MTIYYKFLNTNRMAPYSGYKWPQLKHWTPEIMAPLSLCEIGYHITEEKYLLDWLAPQLYRVEVRGAMLRGDNKIAVGAARLVEQIDTWNERTARIFAAECGYRVLDHFERQYPHDQRPREALDTAVAYANGTATINDLQAARDAAWDAAWVAARDAAWAAARDAAGVAAGAVGDAERQWQNDRLIELLELKESRAND